MRKDMAKVIIDTGRHPGWQRLTYRKIRRKENEAVRRGEEVPEKESMRKVYGYERKIQSDRLAPLWNFLYKNVGRNWNDIHKELCEHINVNDQIGNHILEHVYVNARFKNGKLTGYPDNDWFSSWRDLYVDDNGILRRKPPRKRQAPKKEVTDVRLNDRERYLRDDAGMWYRCTVETIAPPEHKYEKAFSRWYVCKWTHKGGRFRCHKDWRNRLRWEFHGEIYDKDKFLVVTSKRQIGGKELKALKKRLSK